MANVNMLLQELDYIKSLLQNKSYLSNELTAIEQRHQGRRKEVTDKALEEEKALYEKKAATMATPPFPFVDVEEQKAAPTHPDLSSSVRSRLNPRVKYVAYVKEYAITTYLYLAVLIFAGLFVLGIPVFWIFNTFLLTALGIFGFSTVLPVCFLVAFIRKSKKQDVIYDQKQADNLEEYAKWQEQEATWNKEIEAYINGLDMDRYREPIEAVFDQTKQYTEAFHALVEDFDKDAGPIYKKYTSGLRESKRIAESERAETEQKILMNDAAINAVTLIHPDMFGRIDKLYTALSHGRADTIKEAINIVLDDERRAAEEAQRQAEAERQLQLQQQRAAEERERIKDLQKAAEKKAREDEEKKRKELLNAQLAAINRCGNCAHCSSCSYNLRESFKKSGDICPSYFPNSRR